METLGVDKDIKENFGKMTHSHRALSGLKQAEGQGGDDPEFQHF